MRTRPATGTPEWHDRDSGCAAAPISISWKSSYWVVVILALCIGTLTVASSIGLDWAMHSILRPVYASDLLEGIAATVLSGVALVRMQTRKRELIVRMQIVEDVNHHVRNALTAITLSASLQANPELNAQVREASDRIDWVLSNVLSHTVAARDSMQTNHRWRPGLQLDPSRQQTRPNSR